MGLKLDDGAVLFSAQDMRRLRARASGAMGSTRWVGSGESAEETAGESGKCGDGGGCAAPRADSIRAAKHGE